jgi:hypothetical protein
MFNDFARLFRNDTALTRRSVEPLQIIYHAERDGVAERQLKEHWVQLFRLSPGIRKAFFVSATVAGVQTPTAMLALVSVAEPDAALLRDVEKRVQAIWPAETPLEVVVLRPGDCAAIERVCTAFYYAA